MEQQCKEDRVLLAKVSCEKVWSKVSSYEVQNFLCISSWLLKVREQWCY